MWQPQNVKIWVQFQTILCNLITDITRVQQNTISWKTMLQTTITRTLNLAKFGSQTAIIAVVSFEIQNCGLNCKRNYVSDHVSIVALCKLSIG